MKTKLVIIVIIALLTCFTNSYSQDQNIEQLSVMYNNQVTKLCDTIYGFKGPRGIIRGYQWGNEKSASIGILANQNSIISDFLFEPKTGLPDQNLQDSAYLLVSDFRFWTATIYDTSLSHSHSMTFEPTLHITENNPTQYQILEKRPNDPTRPIFGFTQIDNLARIPIDSSEPDSSFLIINNTTLIDSMVFSEPWGSEYLYRTDYEQRYIVFNAPSQKKFQGYNYCVSINLKRLNKSFPLTDDTAHVLEIKLPYTLHNNTSGYITFDAVPSDTIKTIETTCHEIRGKKTTMLYLTNTAQQSFIIKKNMLPADFTTITVTARFRCWGWAYSPPPNFSNPRLSAPTTRDDFEIRKLGFEAYYKGGCPVAIGYVRICTPYSVELFEGQRDALIRKVIQSDIDTIKRYDSLTNKGVQIHRFNSSTEGSVQNFDVERYMTKLIGNVFATTTFPTLPILFDYYVQPPNRVLIGGFVGTSINAPYIKKGLKNIGERYLSLGFIAGRTQMNTYDPNPLTLDQQLNSGYETFYPIKDTLWNHYTYSDFQGINLTKAKIYDLQWPSGGDSKSRSFQCFHQFQMWNLFYNEKVTGFQYCDKPWYLQTQNIVQWYLFPKYIDESDTVEWNKYVTPDRANKGFIYDTVNKKYLGVNFAYINDFGRPFTAEEARLIAFEGISQGAKGLVYDGLSYYQDECYTRYAHRKPLISNPMLPNENKFNYLMRNEFGSDYLNIAGEADTGSPFYFGLFKALYLNMLKPDPLYADTLIRTKLGCSIDSIYMGRRSIRTELYKIHSWLKANDSMLLSLKLICWYGKGVFSIYNQHPDYDSLLTGNLMDKFLYKDSIKTRKLWQSVANSAGYKPTNYEPLSERFFDITIHKKVNTPFTQSYVLSVVNRRTDPLIYYTQDQQRYIKFISASDFDELCFGEDSLYYRDMYFKRFGAREISIPMKNPTSLANSEISFRVTELGYDNDSLKKEFWFQEPYNHVIDTNLLVGDTLRLRMLPGAMKMLNVEVLTPTDVVSGTLEYSNQTKLVAFPCDSNYNAHDTFDIGKVRYHAVYSRRSNLMPGAYYNVYYKRSKPMNRFDKLDKVDDWEDEHQLNDSVFIYDCSQVPDTAYSLESNYPSLVVRCDTINNIPTPMVYVVYQAIGGGCIDSTKIRIIENVFPANTATIITMARQIADVHADVEIIPSGSRFGIPVINASSNGNYYAWNDSLKGIVAGFKTPGQRGWIPPNQRDQFKIFSTDIFHEPHAYHPSLNTYSTISADEMDCALVWEESWSGIYRDQFNQIFYTRLKYCPLTGLSHYVTKEWSVNDNWYKKAIYNIDSTIVRLDDPSAFFQYLHLPTVYRDVEYYNAYNPPVYNGMWPNLAKTERIYYQGRVSYLGYQQGIFMKFISTGDSFNLAGCPRTLPMNWMVEGPSMILSANKDLAHPNVVQGKLVKEYSFPSGNVYYSGAAYVNDSSLVINFVEYPHNPNLMAEVPRTADIWQINHGYFSLFYGPFSYDYGLQFPNNTPKAHRIGSQGKYSHLARLPYINNDKTWEYGHRIFESSSDPFGQNPQIMSYDYLLCKKSYDAEANYIFYGFEDTLGNRSVFSPIYMTIDGRDRSYVPRFDKTNKIYSDTLYSEYFEIGNYQDIDMLQFGSNKKCLDLKLQRKDDKKLFSVQTDKSSERFDYTKHNIHLGNGKSKEYRFAWIKTTKSDFTVMTILGLPPMNEITKDEMLGKTSINVDENYLDLSSDMTSEIPEGSSLSIYPNPAKEKVMIFYEQERKSNINISIYGMLGSKIQSVFSGDIDKGKYQYSVNTKDIPAGIYFVRVEGNNKTIVKKLVIE